jgi:hypothetical protein
MKTLYYVCQCTDKHTGKIGCFSYDITSHIAGKGFTANSPIFQNLQEFYYWAKLQGWKSPPYGLSMTMTKG